MHSRAPRENSFLMLSREHHVAGHGNTDSPASPAQKCIEEQGWCTPCAFTAQELSWVQGWTDKKMLEESQSFSSFLNSIPWSMEQCQDLASSTGKEGSLCPVTSCAKLPAFCLLAKLQNIPHSSAGHSSLGPYKNLSHFSPRTVKPSNVSLQRREAGQRRDVGGHFIW